MCLAHDEGTGEVSTEKIERFVDLGLNTTPVLRVSCMESSRIERSTGLKEV